MAERPSSETSVSTKLQRIATLARQSPQMSFTTLAHHIDVAWLHEAYRRTRKDGAHGIDGQTAPDYAADLEGNLQSLLARAKSGRYRAPAVRRVHIPKGSGRETRPIGIPTFEDKVLQRAVAMALEAVYEQDFYEFSFGFRPGRSAHHALKAVWKNVTDMGGCWIVEVDIRKFFDTLDHDHLRSILRQRVRDGVVLRLIGKWLNAGVLEGSELSYPESGTPQGGVISPLLANIYLHEVLDQWFVKTVKPALKGEAFMVRYADDFVMGFRHESDARRVLRVLAKRFERFGLKIHEGKTRMVDFRRPLGRPGRGPGPHKGQDTFDLLGFTHYWGSSRSGYWLVRRRTASSRLSRSLRAVSLWCRQRRHLPITEQHRVLCAKVRGHYAYYGITNNWSALARFVRAVERIWRRWLARRAENARFSWDRHRRLLERLPLPPPRILHRM